MKKTFVRTVMVQAAPTAVGLKRTTIQDVSTATSAKEQGGTKMDPEKEIEILRKLIRKCQSPRFWAGLSFIRGAHGKKSIWTEEEQEALIRAGLKERK